MSHGTPLSIHELRRIAVEAEADPRTVARAIEGLRVQPMTLARIVKALKKLHYPLPASADRVEDGKAR